MECKLATHPPPPRCGTPIGGADITAVDSGNRIFLYRSEMLTPQSDTIAGSSEVEEDGLPY